MKLFSAFACGWIFALGLGLARMTQPARIIAFLDVAGAWDPGLMWVMAGAVTLGLVSFPRVLSRPKPVFEERFTLPLNVRVDGRLVAGAALFGIGWGLSGYCPGPALVSLVTAKPPILVFASSMLAGLGLGLCCRREGRRGKA